MGDLLWNAMRVGMYAVIAALFAYRAVLVRRVRVWELIEFGTPASVLIFQRVAPIGGVGLMLALFALVLLISLEGRDDWLGTLVVVAAIFALSWAHTRKTESGIEHSAPRERPAGLRVHIFFTRLWACLSEDDARSAAIITTPVRFAGRGMLTFTEKHTPPSTLSASRPDPALLSTSHRFRASPRGSLE